MTVSRQIAKLTSASATLRACKVTSAHCNAETLVTFIVAYHTCKIAACRYYTLTRTTTPCSRAADHPHRIIVLLTGTRRCIANSLTAYCARAANLHRVHRGLRVAAMPPDGVCMAQYS